jgi:hypothetical protein
MLSYAVDDDAGSLVKRILLVLSQEGRGPQLRADLLQGLRGADQRIGDLLVRAVVCKLAQRPEIPGKQPRLLTELLEDFEQRLDDVVLSFEKLSPDGGVLLAAGLAQEAGGTSVHGCLLRYAEE